MLFGVNYFSSYFYRIDPRSTLIKKLYPLTSLGLAQTNIKCKTNSLTNLKKKVCKKF